MHQMYTLAILFWMSCPSSISTYQKTEPKLNVTIYYETLCPYCATLFSKQVKSTWENLKDYVKFILVPYGHSQQEKLEDGKWNFTCQHGPAECYGNKIQSCGIHYLREDSNQQVQFAVCFMSQNYPPFNLTCFRNSKEEQKFRSCINSEYGDNLMAENGNITHSTNPSIKGVPAIAFNGIHNYTLEDNAREDLEGTICKLFEQKPKPCLTQDGRK